MHDHRKLGRELGLFDTDPLIGAGLPYWLPDGAVVPHTLEEYIRAAERRAGYRHVYSPALGKRELYEISGHWAHYSDDMFPPMNLGGEQVVLRPSLCPSCGDLSPPFPQLPRTAPATSWVGRYVPLRALGRAWRADLVHRSIFGSVERVVAHLIEQHGGAFPAWLAPAQLVLLPISDTELPNAAALAQGCTRLGLRAEIAGPGPRHSRRTYPRGPPDSLPSRHRRQGGH